MNVGRVSCLEMLDAWVYEVISSDRESKQVDVGGLSTVNGKRDEDALLWAIGDTMSNDQNLLKSKKNTRPTTRGDQQS